MASSHRSCRDLVMPGLAHWSKCIARSQSDTSTTRMMIDALATMVSPAGTKLVDERREHMLLYNLIGDPTLRLHHPQPLAIVIPPGHESGELIQLQIKSPISGELKPLVRPTFGGGHQRRPQRNNDCFPG